MWAITATVVRVESNGYRQTIQVPTFFLDERVQGIVSKDHAERIARSVIDPTNSLETHVYAGRVG